MSTSIIINYDTLNDICNKSKDYIEALEQIKSSLSSINSLVENCEGETAQELLNCHEDLQNDLTEVHTEVSDINRIFENYINDMESIISADDSSSNILVDRDDIWWNLESICGACEAIKTLRYTVGAFKGFPSFNLTDEEKSNQETNYSNLENIWSIIEKYGNILSGYEDEMRNLFNTKIVNFDETDSAYGKSAKSQLYDKYTDTWEGISNFFLGVAKNEFDKGRGFFDSMKDFVVGTITLSMNLQELEANIVVSPFSAICTEFTGDEPDWAKDNLDYMNKFTNGLEQILYDPTIIVEGLCQNASDTYQEEGLSYCVGYLNADIMQFNFLKGGKKVKGIAEETVNSESKAMTSVEAEASIVASEAKCVEGAMDIVSKIAPELGIASSGLAIEDSLKSFGGIESSVTKIGEVEVADEPNADISTGAKEAMALEGAMDAVSSVTTGLEAGATGMASSGLEIENSLKSLEGADSSAANIGKLDKADDLEQVVNGEVYYDNIPDISGKTKGDFNSGNKGKTPIEGVSKAEAVIKTQKDVKLPTLPKGSQWERNVLNSFEGGKASNVTYKGGTTLYRIGGKNGGFWSLNPPPMTEYQWRVDYAIKQEFCNDATTLYKITIPEGSSLSALEGKVGQQGMGLYGGAHQAYIDYREVPKDWIEIIPQQWK